MAAIVSFSQLQRNVARAFGIRRSPIADRRREVKTTDVFLASYPQSGSTWMQLLMADAVQQIHGMQASTALPISNDRIFPDLDRGDSLVVDARIRLPFRLVQTHSPYHSVMNKTIVIFRKPVDSLCSYYDFCSRDQRGKNRIVGDPDAFCRRYVGQWVQHLDSYLDVIDRGRLNAFVTCYAQLHAAPALVLKSAMSFLGVDVGPLVAQRAVQRHTFENQRASEAPAGHDNEEFFRRGQIGSTAEELSAATIALVEERTARTLERGLRHLSVGASRQAS